MNTRTGESVAVAPEDVHQLPLKHDPQTEGVDHGLLIFHPLILENITNEFPGIHVSELEREEAWVRRSSAHQASLIQALGAVPHGLEGVAAGVFWNAIDRVRERWLDVCGLVVTFELCRRVILPLLVWYILPALRIFARGGGWYKRRRLANVEACSRVEEERAGGSTPRRTGAGTTKRTVPHYEELTTPRTFSSAL